MPNLSALLNARSVAIVGASTREGSFGWHLLRQLLDFGYSGAIYPVHPTATEIAGLETYPTCAAIGCPIDCAAICVGDERLEAAVLDAIAAKIPSAIIFGTAATLASDGHPLTDWLRETARAHDLTLLGANGMGFFNFTSGLFLNGYPYHRPRTEGCIGFITHSGSLFSAVAKNTRSLNFNLVISPGQELVVTAADYLRYLLDLPSTRVVGLVLETIRDPASFLAALDHAVERRIAIVLLKIGRTEHGAAMALAHTGAIAGQHATIEALAARFNVCLVTTMDEMMDTLELFASGRTFAQGELAAVADSGGERGLMVDLATDLRLPWADLSPQTVAVLQNTLDPGLAAVNPVDLWGTGQNWQEVFRAAIGALLVDPNVGALSYGIDFNIGSRLNADYRQIAIQAAQSTSKPVAVVSNIAAGTDPGEAAQLRSAGLPVLLGTQSGLAAFAHLRNWSHRAAKVAAWNDCLAQTPFDLSTGPINRP
ncbi:MAG TPA: CoA-binding protein, partial [Thermomicrobiales bacterium]|nr:CoA-binding protein [Thermomicrobiales bacterium]